MLNSRRDGQSIEWSECAVVLHEFYRFSRLRSELRGSQCFYLSWHLFPVQFSNAIDHLMIAATGPYNIPNPLMF